MTHLRLMALSPFRHSASGLRRSLFAFCAVIAAVCLPATSQAKGVPESFADLVQKVSPAVVNVSAVEKHGDLSQLEEQLPELPPNSPFRQFFKDFLKRQQSQPTPPVVSLGSGFIIDASGIVVTNDHVVKDADRIRVILHDHTVLPAKIIAVDTKTDIAVLRVKPPHPLPALKWGNSDFSRVGDWVLAIGNPFGLGGTVTAGIISARGRDLHSGPYDDFIQTDAPINRGNSGGPLLNMAGHVIGINTAIFSEGGGSLGIGFAIPSSLAEPVVAQLLAHGHVERGWLGVRIQTVTEDIAESLGLRRPEGALVAAVIPNSPASHARFKPGDVILRFNGKPVREMDELPRLVAGTPVGKRVAVDVWRAGKHETLAVTIAELKEPGQHAMSEKTKKERGSKPAQPPGVQALGMTLSTITPTLREKYKLGKEVKGVVITAVKPNGAAASQNIQPGDVIVQTGQSRVTTPDEVVAEIAAARKAKRGAVLFMVERGTDRLFVALPLTAGG